MRKKQQNGVTLIALVVTIVILLILATISISVISGRNGLVDRTQDAQNSVGQKRAEEKVETEILKSYDKYGNIDCDLLNTNLKKNIEGLTYNGKEISEDDSNRIKPEDMPATVVVDGYNVIIDEKIQDEEIQETQKIVEDLKVGEKVYYNTGNSSVGNQGVIECIVLYDKQYDEEHITQYGIQVIATDIVSTISIGNGIGSDQTKNQTYFNRARDAYNNALKTLYTEAQKYLNTNYAINARSVGSKPDDPDWDTNTMYTASDNYTFMQNYNGTFKNWDANYEIDLGQMRKSEINTVNIGKEYYLASHDINQHDDKCYMNIISIENEGELRDNPLCSIFINNAFYSNNFSFGFRPVFRLYPDLKIIRGNGDSEPYEIENRD